VAQITGEKKPAVAAGFDSPQTVNLSGASGRKRERLTHGEKTINSRLILAVIAAGFKSIVPSFMT